MKQKSLKERIELSGIGIHTGKKVQVSINPSTENKGITLCRTDLDSDYIVPVSVETALESAAGGLRQTAIKCGEGEVKTIEHLLAALHAFGITNAHIEIDNEELPALDGSSLEYVKAIKTVGTIDQADIEPIIIDKPICLDDSSIAMTVIPYDGLKVSYTLSYGHPDLRDQFLSLDVTSESFENDLAPARTFCLKEEADYLQSKGLGQGATTSNTLVFKKNLPVDNELRFSDEACRHKMVDLIGDLYLLGKPLRGHVITAKTGHAQNFLLAKTIHNVTK